MERCDLRALEDFTFETGPGWANPVGPDRRSQKRPLVRVDAVRLARRQKPLVVRVMLEQLAQLPPLLIVELPPRDHRDRSVPCFVPRQRRARRERHHEREGDESDHTTCSHLILLITTAACAPAWRRAS